MRVHTCTYTVGDNLVEGTQEAFEKVTTSGLVAFGLDSGEEKLK